MPELALVAPRAPGPLPLNLADKVLAASARLPCIDRNVVTGFVERAVEASRALRSLCMDLYRIPGDPGRCLEVCRQCGRQWVSDLTDVHSPEDHAEDCAAAPLELNS